MASLVLGLGDQLLDHWQGQPELAPELVVRPCANDAHAAPPHEPPPGGIALLLCREWSQAASAAHCSQTYSQNGSASIGKCDVECKSGVVEIIHFFIQYFKFVEYKQKQKPL